MKSDIKIENCLLFNNYFKADEHNVAGRYTVLRVYIWWSLNSFSAVCFKTAATWLNEFILKSLTSSICYQIINDYINDSVCITKMSLDLG